MATGIGDEIMASGQARRAYNETGKRVVVVGKNGRPRWNDIWRGLPWMVTPGEKGKFVRVVNGPQCRPYITYPFSRALGCTYSGWSANDNVGAIHLFPEEKEYARNLDGDIGNPFIIIEPNLAPTSNPNKQWGWEKWQSLANILKRRGHLLAQIGPAGTRTLNGVTLLATPSFRHGAAVLARSNGAILPEGGLHHAAAALGKRAVVLFGGAVDVTATGYDIHTNITRAPVCGRWMPCNHCKHCWNDIYPSEVADIFETAKGA